MTDERKEQIRSIANSMRKQPCEVSMENACYIANIMLDLLAEIERLEAQRAKETSGLRDQIAMMLLDAVLKSRVRSVDMIDIWAKADEILQARSKGDE